MNIKDNNISCDLITYSYGNFDMGCKVILYDNFTFPVISVFAVIAWVQLKIFLDHPHVLFVGIISTLMRKEEQETLTGRFVTVQEPVLVVTDRYLLLLFFQWDLRAKGWGHSIFSRRKGGGVYPQQTDD